MYKYVKRFLDFFMALILLILLFIPMIIVAIAIKIEDRGPAIFKQERTGKNGKNFYLMKFRSMKINNDVRDFSKKDELTKVGKFIRKTSLDELPQIFNILKGQMSFIGPRPWIVEYYEYMTEEQRRRTSVLPGMTGLAQASGRNGISIIDKINYDLKYVDNFSFKQDVYIVFKTIYVVLKKESVDIGKEGIKSELEILKEQKKEKTNIAKKVVIECNDNEKKEELVGA